MVSLTHAFTLLATVALLGGCDDLIGFGGAPTPLATVQLATSGDFEAVRVAGATDEDLHVALVWGTQWLPEPLCFLPPESPEVAAVVVAGCRDPLSFTPARVADSVAIGPGVPTTLPLFTLPSADVMVGDVTARVAYASLVLYDDRDHSGTLELARSRRGPIGGMNMPEPDLTTNDIVYGASLVSMSQPDTRLAFREGGFIESGFYPRHGCGAPPPAFSILGAGGFTFEAALAATLAGELPAENPSTCSEATPDAATVTIALRQPSEVREVGCEQRREDSSVRYRQPPSDPIDVTNRVFACAAIPSFGGDPSTDGIVQLVVATGSDDTCKGLTHYTLFGCDNGGFTCDAPEWDFRANPPAWWPCPVGAAR